MCTCGRLTIDETALLNAARVNKFTLLERSKAETVISTPFTPGSAGLLGADVGADAMYVSDPVREVYTPLAVLAFTSDRKRASVVVRTPAGRVHVYCKGADSTLAPLIRGGIPTHAQEALDRFSSTGLRTLVLAYRELSEDAYAAWKEELDEAERAISGREAAVAAVCEQVEVDMVFLGATAIEDRLQDDVPETIDFLLKVCENAIG